VVVTFIVIGAEFAIAITVITEGAFIVFCLGLWLVAFLFWLPHLLLLWALVVVRFIIVSAN